jgi:hypothetical protein
MDAWDYVALVRYSFNYKVILLWIFMLEK